MDEGDETDLEALANGYASIVPVKIDFTDLAAKRHLEERWKDIL
jgi:5'-nucleotidase